MRAKCYSEYDRVLMIERVRENQTGIQNRKLKRSHIIETIKDPQIWCYILIEIMYAASFITLEPFCVATDLIRATAFRSPQVVWDHSPPY